MTQGARVCIEWLEPRDLAALAQRPPPEGIWARALICDLRDPLILRLLRPVPSISDFADERRPGASDRSYFLARRAALRSLVAMHLACAADAVVIGYDAPGAPRVIGREDIFVSVSGRGALAALAVANAPVGIDLEPLHESVEIIADVLHASEGAMLDALPEARKRERFLQIWTAKEAFLKALGTGLNIDPATVAIVFDKGTPASIARDGVNAQASVSARRETLAGAAVTAACVLCAAG